MKSKYIILTLIFGLIGYGLFFYFKPFRPIDNSVSIDKIIITKHKQKLDLILVKLIDRMICLIK